MSIVGNTMNDGSNLRPFRPRFEGRKCTFVLLCTLAQSDPLDW